MHDGQDGTRKKPTSERFVLGAAASSRHAHTAQIGRLLIQSKAPTHQSTLSTRRVTLDPVDDLPGQASLSRNLSDAHGLLSQHRADLVELLAREAWLAADVGAVATLLGVLDSAYA